MPREYNAHDVVLDRRSRIVAALTKNPMTTTKELAKTLNASVTTIVRDRLALKRAGLLPRAACHHMTATDTKLEEVKRKIRALEGFGELENYSWRELAKRFHCSLHVVSQAFDHLKAEIETPCKIDPLDLDFWNRAKRTVHYPSYQDDRKRGYLGARLPREEYTRYREIRRLKDQYYMKDRAEYLRRLELLLARAKRKKRQETKSQ